MRQWLVQRILEDVGIDSLSYAFPHGTFFMSLLQSFDFKTRDAAHGGIIAITFLLAFRGQAQGYGHTPL